MITYGKVTLPRLVKPIPLLRLLNEVLVRTIFIVSDGRIHPYRCRIKNQSSRFFSQGATSIWLPVYTSPPPLSPSASQYCITYNTGTEGFHLEECESGGRVCAELQSITVL